MLEINKPYKFTLNTQDYVVWQNDKGEVFALNNICPHMQAPLSNGWIYSKTSAIACPFHGLEFNHKGQVDRSQSSGKSLVRPLELFFRISILHRRRSRNYKKGGRC